MENIEKEIENIKGRKIIHISKTVIKTDYTIISEQDYKWDIVDFQIDNNNLDENKQKYIVPTIPTDIKKRKYLSELIGLKEIPLQTYDAFNELNGLFDNYFKENDAEQIDILKIMKIDEEFL